MLIRMLLVCGFAVAASYAMAQSPLAVSFGVPPALTLQEPVIVNLTLHNLLREPITLDLGWNRKVGFAIMVKGPDGRIQRPTITPSGVGRSGRIEIDPSGDYSQPLILNDWLAFDQPGSYQIEIRLTAPIRTASGQVVKSPTADAFDVQIGPRDEDRLRQSYQRLADAFVNSAGVEQYQAAHALRYLTDPVAVPILRAVLDANDAADPIVIEALRKTRTPEAVSLLQEVTKTGGKERAALAKNALERLKWP
jgi:hypothetical protein